MCHTRTHMHTYAHTCTHTYARTHSHIHTRMHVHTCMHVHTRKHKIIGQVDISLSSIYYVQYIEHIIDCVWMCICIYICMYVCMYVRMYVYVCLSVCLCVRMTTSTFIKPQLTYDPVFLWLFTGLSKTTPSLYTAGSFILIWWGVSSGFRRPTENYHIWTRLLLENYVHINK